MFVIFILNLNIWESAEKSNQNDWGEKKKKKEI